MLDDYTKLIKDHKVLVAELSEIIGVLVLIQIVTGILLYNVVVHPCQ
jgi:hypothetical protein